MHDDEDDEFPETDTDRARSALEVGSPVEAVAWAVLALAGEVYMLRRETRKERR